MGPHVNFVINTSLSILFPLVRFRSISFFTVRNLWISIFNWKGKKKREKKFSFVGLFKFDFFFTSKSLRAIQSQYGRDNELSFEVNETIFFLNINKNKGQVIFLFFQGVLIQDFRCLHFCFERTKNLNENPRRWTHPKTSPFSAPLPPPLKT